MSVIAVDISTTPYAALCTACSSTGLATSVAVVVDLVAFLLLLYKSATSSSPTNTMIAATMISAIIIPAIAPPVNPIVAQYNNII